MTADEIREAFGHNAVYEAMKDPYNQHRLQMLEIMATGELAAQICEANVMRKQYLERNPKG